MADRDVHDARVSFITETQRLRIPLDEAKKLWALTQPPYPAPAAKETA
ncbi:hypothetical protein ACFVAJ_18390 [Agromyces sp. NPDC057679]